jgi:MFS family permease
MLPSLSTFVPLWGKTLRRASLYRQIPLATDLLYCTTSTKKRLAVETLPSRAPIKFAFLFGTLTVLGTIFASLYFAFGGRWQHGKSFLVSSIVFALTVLPAPYLADRMGWLALRISLRRSLLSVVPLAFVPIAFFIGMAGWGDPQEHLIRRILHATHREIPEHIVGTLILAGVIVFGAAAISSLCWISLSVFTKKWRARTLLTLCVGCSLLSALFWVTLLAGNAVNPAFVAGLGLSLVFVCGFLFALAMEMNATSHGLSISFRVASSVVFVALLGGGSFVFAKSSPEKRFPKLETGPLWQFDIGSTGCHPSWGAPNSSAATNEIAFATDKLLGMAFETNATPLPNNKWEYKSCIFTIDAATGSKIAQLSIEGNQPIINRSADGRFEVLARGAWTTYTADLKQVGEPKPFEKSQEGWTAAKWRNFHSDSHGKLLFDGESGTTVIAQFPGDLIYIHPLGSERVLVTGGRRFSLFRADGTLISTETFLREGVNFAALSADHHRFAMAVYLWGVGDPSYLEEEKIIVYDADVGKALASVPSDPLPQQQSWAALSPDGSLLAVGAQNSLRLFRLPSSAPEVHPQSRE